jgi:DNA-binding NarL/FixJ family response regulator
VARLLASGVAYKEIAWRLGIKMGTVQSHVMGVYRKLGVACKEDLMRKARGEPLGYDADAKDVADAEASALSAGRP